MKLTNTSSQVQKVHPPDGPGFAVAHGATVDLPDSVAAELLQGLPLVWTAENTTFTPAIEAEEKDGAR